LKPWTFAFNFEARPTGLQKVTQPLAEGYYKLINIARDRQMTKLSVREDLNGFDTRIQNWSTGFSLRDRLPQIRPDLDKHDFARLFKDREPQLHNELRQFSQETSLDRWESNTIDFINKIFFAPKS
jgi:hypothetical protein